MIRWHKIQIYDYEIPFKLKGDPLSWILISWSSFVVEIKRRFITTNLKSLSLVCVWDWNTIYDNKLEFCDQGFPLMVKHKVLAKISISWSKFAFHDQTRSVVTILNFVIIVCVSISNTIFDQRFWFCDHDSSFGLKHDPLRQILFFFSLFVFHDETRSLSTNVKSLIMNYLSWGKTIYNHKIHICSCELPLVLKHYLWIQNLYLWWWLVFGIETLFVIMIVVRDCLWDWKKPLKTVYHRI
jgi:hypothetical protein